MTPHRLLMALVAVLALSSLDVPEATAQVRRFRPNTPAVSPYLNLLRDNDGALPNYYSLVRPQLQAQSFMNQQTQFNQQTYAESAQQAAAIGALTTQLQPGIGPTGKGSQFMTSGRYFLNSGASYGAGAGRRRR